MKLQFFHSTFFRYFSSSKIYLSIRFQTVFIIVLEINKEQTMKATQKDISSIIFWSAYSNNSVNKNRYDKLCKHRIFLCKFIKLILKSHSSFHAEREEKIIIFHLKKMSIIYLCMRTYILDFSEFMSNFCIGKILYQD